MNKTTRRLLNRLAVVVACFGPVLMFAALAVLFTDSARSAPLGPVAPPIDPKIEVRQCGEPPRAADGAIRRSAAVLYAFRKLHPCPLNGLRYGACPGWSVNHVIPLAKGGCDAVSNMQWLPDVVKSCSHAWCVDRWERNYWGDPHGIVVLPSLPPPPGP